MKSFKKLSALVLVVMFVFSCFTTLGITASAASTVYFDPGEASTGNPAWFAWTWDGGVSDQWVTGVPDGNYIRFDGCGNKIVFVRMPEGSTQGDWNTCWNQSEDLDVTDNLATFSGWNNQKFYTTWSHYDGGGDIPTNPVTTPTQSGNGITVTYNNTLGWSDVNVHYWNSASSGSTWPGIAMTNNGSAWTATVPADSVGVVFNTNGGNTQTIDGNLSQGTEFTPTGDTDEKGHYVIVAGGYTPTQGQPTQATQYTGGTTPYNPGQTDSGLVGYYNTNKNGYGAQKTITVDGDNSDWDSSMLIAQGTANDDPRVYRPNSMYENPIDLYALYGAYDNNNLYLYWEMTNVQDVVSPLDDYPLAQGHLYQTENLPFFIAIDTGKSDAIGNNSQLSSGGTIWNSGISFQNSTNRLIAISTNGSNGPFIYGGDASGLNPVEKYNQTTSGITFKWGEGIKDSHVYGINKGHGSYNGRVVGDMCNPNAAWVDFNAEGHNSSKYDYHYEMSIPLDKLGVSASDIASNGIGACLVATYGKSGMDCLPYDLSMNDNADQEDTQSQPNNSFEKSDEDFVKTAFARIGKAGSVVTPTQATEPTQPQTQATQPQTQATQPQTQATQPQTQATQPQTQATQPQTQAGLTASVKLNGTQVKSVNVSGNTLTVSYNLTAPLPITDGDLALSYDSSKLTLSQVTMPKISGGNIATSPNTASNPYLINFTGVNQSSKSGLYDFTSGGVLVQAKFNVNSGASGTASVNLTINELDALKNGTTTSYFSDAMATSDGQALLTSLKNPTVEAGGAAPTQATQPQTQATQPQTQATQPQTQATQPQTQATQPQTQATQPQTQPQTQATQPQTQATQPQTQATQPQTQATQPQTQPTQQPTGGYQYQTSIVAVAEKNKIYVGGSTYISVSLTNGIGRTTFKSSNTKVAIVTSKGKVIGRKAGTAIITAKNNTASSTVRITVVKKANPIKVTGKTVKIKAKKATTISKAKAYKITNAKGTVTFKKASGNSKFTVNKKTGKITVKKGLKKGTYKLKVKVTAKGNTMYKKGTKAATVKIVVK